jgi:hypothetical protein
MTFRTKMIISGILFFGGFGLVAATLPTFGRRCAEAFDPKSAAYERCVVRLSEGTGGVHYIKKIELVPVTD